MLFFFFFTFFFFLVLFQVHIFRVSPKPRTNFGSRGSDTVSSESDGGGGGGNGGGGGGRRRGRGGGDFQNYKLELQVVVTMMGNYPSKSIEKERFGEESVGGQKGEKKDRTATVVSGATGGATGGIGAVLHCVVNVCPSDARTRYNGVSVVAVSGFFQRIDEYPFVFLFLFWRPVLVTVPITVVGGIGLLFFCRQHFQTHGPTRFVVLVSVVQC